MFMRKAQRFCKDITIPLHKIYHEVKNSLYNIKKSFTIYSFNIFFNFRDKLDFFTCIYTVFYAKIFVYIRSFKAAINRKTRNFFSTFIIIHFIIIIITIITIYKQMFPQKESSIYTKISQKISYGIMLL